MGLVWLGGCCMEVFIMVNKFVCVVVVLVVVVLLQVQVVFDFFLKILGVFGESSDSKYKNEIDVLFWVWGVSNNGVGSVFELFMWEQQMDVSFVLLFLGFVNDILFVSVQLLVCKFGCELMEFFRMMLIDVYVVLLISQFGVDMIIVDVVVCYGGIVMYYCMQKVDGIFGVCYDGGFMFGGNYVVFSGDLMVL